MTDTQPRSLRSWPADTVRWGPVVAGAVIGLGLHQLLTILWLAAAADGSTAVTVNLSWFLVGSAAAALFVAGLVAGNLAGVHTPAAGVANGVTAWGLLFVLTTVTVVPAGVNPAANLGAGGAILGGPANGQAVPTSLWATFWALLAGLVLAALGGLLGGLLRRPGARRAEPAAETVPEHPVEVH
ncbi:hypothetical protein ACQEVB_31785 [Pseudonocardia sp. CA-107938]|uniref:hypothetical protein n=1 Tax=Pseudonocardia sp. CA-107938 TaxID=3240021 RepID=UPI003D8EB3E5